MMFGRIGLGLLIVSAAAVPLKAERYQVLNQQEYAKAVSQADAGDVIVLAKGEWRDFDMVVTGKGTASEPISVVAEEPGAVFLTGQSSLRIGGEHIVVSGLVFRDGYSPRGEVISFRRSKDDVARNARVTQVVIDRFNKPDRFESDYWVGIYGRNNRFDHNHLVGKTNQGVTLAVRLDAPENRENDHRIDHNYFGPRPVLGSNGGETIRIGTSKYSMFRSGTIVENNVFDRCDGEVEIISNKSNGNVYRGNLFLRSRGTLTLRHGDDTLVERNVFLGGGKDYTGGIRVINRNQTVRFNYMEGLRGNGFSSALTVMNGVPNSPVNRYVQVDNARISRNTVVDSARVTLGAGADEERSAPPINSVFSGNLLSGLDEGTFIEVDADISGIAFDDNAVVEGKVHSAAASLRKVATEMERGANGLLYPVDPSLADVGAPRDLAPIALSDVGVDWYPKPGEDEAFGASGVVTRVMPGEDTLGQAVAAAGSGDVLMLEPGEYIANRVIAVDRTLAIRGAKSGEGAGATIRFTRPSLLELQDGGNLQLTDLEIDGSLAPDSVGNAVIRTSAFPIQKNFRVEFEGVAVRNLVVNKSFSVFVIGKGALADRVSIRRSAFSDITGTVVSAESETDDFGRYNVEYLDMVDSTFADVGGPVASVYRGGTDESTFGPFVTVAGNTFSNVGHVAAEGSRASILLHGVQRARIARNTFDGSAPMIVEHTVGTPETAITDNRFVGTAEPIVRELVHPGAPRVELENNETVEGKRP
ncbi:polysaccharide lyase 6 family protein [Pelagerythrobacter marensis]|uniref:Poly(Beta-D-mannuronate) lyase n=1 Tax=Pelagerythrobacter marensis TaxID=543877 RepID=A0A0G3XBN2_9SPHN|nr:polysaccharide lyase 6 family protein [Pelagerythrobacter marensis]AKM07803.1 hypothetical protein AM2010_1737 [Pelagerythrobacter marensis]